jgi:hypothetical protein
VRRVVDSLKEVVCPHREALAMLLSNVTLATAGAERLLQLQDDETLHGTRPYPEAPLRPPQQEQLAAAPPKAGLETPPCFIRGPWNVGGHNPIPGCACLSFSRTLFRKSQQRLSRSQAGRGAERKSTEKTHRTLQGGCKRGGQCLTRIQSCPRVH